MKTHHTVAIAEPIRIGDYTIIPIEETAVIRSDVEPLWWYGSKRLRAFVLQSEQKVRAYDMEAGETSIAELEEQFADLKALSAAGMQ